ncbi:hypothetical protein BT69DRAFT_780955 [Atractiella rhizophila]|nr:hypothetical protein BT69DRAFT_780955 [Atractiella rhizophila]
MMFLPFFIVQVVCGLETPHGFKRQEVELPASGTVQRIKPLTEYSDADSPFPGVLGRRQSSCIDPGYGKCNSYNYCCPLGGECCGNYNCCGSGKWCYSIGCCDDNENGCDSQGCCQLEEQCCKGGGCCAAGTNCIKFASGNPGCCHTDQGYYPCASALYDFCCPLDSICFVDDLGVPKCRSSVPTYSQATNTPVGGTTSPNGQTYTAISFPTSSARPSATLAGNIGSTAQIVSAKPWWVVIMTVFSFVLALIL